MAFLFIKNTNVLSVTFLPFSECIWRNPLLHEYTSVNAVALLCHGHPILSCRECSWPMYEAELQTLGVSSVKVLGGTWGALPAAHHHVIWGQKWSEHPPLLLCFFHLPLPSVSMWVSHQPYVRRQTLRWPMAWDSIDLTKSHYNQCKRFLWHWHDLCSQNMPHEESHESLGVHKIEMRDYVSS